MGSHCVECAKAARPSVATRARFWNARQPAIVTIGLIGLNLAVFAVAVAIEPAALSMHVTETHVDLALSGQMVAGGDWYRLLTSGFLHYGIIHIGLNMYLLYLLGQMLEPAVGRVKFLLVYLASLLGGSAGALLLDPQALTAGASGAVFGLMGLAFVGAYLHGTNPLQTSIGTLLMMNLFITFLWSKQISVGGHLGGAIAGGLCAFAVMAPRWRGVPTWAGYAAPLVVAVVAVTLSMTTVS